MTVERSFPSGMLIITDIINGQLVKERYMGFTVREAKRLFREEHGK